MFGLSCQYILPTFRPFAILDRQTLDTEYLHVSDVSRQTFKTATNVEVKNRFIFSLFLEMEVIPFATPQFASQGGFLSESIEILHVDSDGKQPCDVLLVASWRNRCHFLRIDHLLGMLVDDIEGKGLLHACVIIFKNNLPL